MRSEGQEVRRNFGFATFPNGPICIRFNMTYWFLNSGNSQRDYSTFFEASTKCYPPWLNRLCEGKLVLCLKCSLEETSSAQFILDHYLKGECFQDEENSRILPHNAMDDKTNKKMTLELCFFLCFDDNEYLYAGVQNGKECWCGNVKPKTPSPKYECDEPCGGDPSQNCGAEG